MSSFGGATRRVGRLRRQIRRKMELNRGHSDSLNLANTALKSSRGAILARAGAETASRMHDGIYRDYLLADKQNGFAERARRSPRDPLASILVKNTVLSLRPPMIRKVASLALKSAVSLNRTIFLSFFSPFFTHARPNAPFNPTSFLPSSSRCVIGRSGIVGASSPIQPMKDNSARPVLLASLRFLNTSEEQLLCH